MRVLTVRQPWAWAIVHGGKDVENRATSIVGSYRGPIAIHAALGWSQAGETDPMVLGAVCATNYTDAPVIEANGYVEREYDEFLDKGVVIGVVNLVDVHPGGVTGCHPDADDPGRLAWCSPWAMSDHHHLVLANPRPLPRPIRATGRLGLWRPDAELLAAITGQIEVSA